MTTLFQLRPSLPRFDGKDAPTVLGWLTTSLGVLRAQCQAAFVAALEELRASAQIKRFTEVTSRQIWVYSSEFPEEPTLPERCLALIDLARPGDFEVLFVGYEVAFKNGGPLSVPRDLGRYREPVPFVAIEPPWRVELYRAGVQALKSQSNLVFKVSVRLAFPIIEMGALPRSEFCSHDFRIVDIGDWQWRLLWECRNCGLACHCKCFENAIRLAPLPAHYERWPEFISVAPDRVPFVDGACEVCRGLPSSHRYCNPTYAASIFESRYGAYLRKRLVELQMNRPRSRKPSPEERDVENQVRKDLGFPPFGKPGFWEAELFRTVRSIFRDEEVLRHSRPDWLGGLEIDVYVPSRRLAIEYQGMQHAAPVAAWGGEDAVANTQDRDRRKERLLAEQGIRLVTFSSADAVTPEAVRERLAPALYSAQ